MRADGRIEDFFFQDGVNLQLCQRLINNLGSPGQCFRLFEFFEQAFDRIVILLQNRNGVGFG
jgi:hypothetical protein